MTLIWGIAAVAIYFGIIGILIKDAMDQIRRQKDERKIIRRNKRNKNWKV